MASTCCARVSSARSCRRWNCRAPNGSWKSGTGSGFLTACLAINAASVRSVELYPDLADLARANLRAAGIRNAEVITADAASDEVASPAAPCRRQSVRRPVRSRRADLRHAPAR